MTSIRDPSICGFVWRRYPCYALSKSGNTSTQLRAVQVRLTSELQDLNRPFEDLRDAVARSLGLGFWAGAYSPFAVVLAPLLMDIMNIEFDDGKIQAYVWIVRRQFDLTD